MHLHGPRHTCLLLIEMKEPEDTRTYKKTGMERRETHPGHAGRHLRANSTPSGCGRWNSKPKLGEAQKEMDDKIRGRTHVHYALTTRWEREFCKGGGAGKDGKGGRGGDMHTQWNGRPVDRPRIRRSALPCQLYASRIWRVEFETKVRKGTQINARQIKGTPTRT